MKRKGFTLLELLAVIVILAIAALIAIPLLLGVIDKAKKGAVRDSVYGLFDAASLYRATRLSGNINEVVTFNCNGKKCQTDSGDTLLFKGEIPTSGQIILKNKKETEAYYLRINKYCVLGNNKHFDVEDDCTKLDTTTPSMEVVQLAQTTKSIVVNVTASDIESGIKSITYEIDGKTITDKYNTTNVNEEKTITDLSDGFSGNLKVIVTNGNNLTEEKTIPVTTNSLTLTLSSTKTLVSTSTEYYQQEVWNINSTENPTGYYIKSTASATSSTGLTKSCGTGTNPGSCSSITSTTTMTANTWYYTETKPSVTYKATAKLNATLYASVTDGKNISGNATGTTNLVVPGIYDETTGNLIANWKYLVDNYHLNVERDYLSDTNQNNGASGNAAKYILNTYYSSYSNIKIVIPDSITKIGEMVFAGVSNLTSVVIGNGVTSIGYNAFSYARSVKSITIGNNVKTIENHAFDGCQGLTSITIPASVTTIGEGAFNWNYVLVSINVESNSQNFASVDGVLFTKDMTRILKYPDAKPGTSYVIPNGVTTIGSHSFRYSFNLTSITIPNSVTTIDNYAFVRCINLTSITIPNSVTTIGKGVFTETSSLTSLTIPASVITIGNYQIDRSGITSITFKNTSGWYLYSDSSYTTGKTAVSVTNASTNATYFASTYNNNYWKRG